MELYNLQALSEAITQRIYHIQNPERARSEREQEIDELRGYILRDLQAVCDLLIDKHPHSQPIEP